MNKILKAIVIDSEPPAIDKVKELAGKIDSLEIVKVCNNSTEARQYISENAVDVIFTEILKPGTPDYLFIRNDREYQKVPLVDIRYISGDAEYLSFHICGVAKPLREKSSFAAVKRLLTREFIQVHRSNIINMRHVSQVGTMYVVMDDGTKIRISESNRDKFYSHVGAITVGRKSAGND